VPVGIDLEHTRSRHADKLLDLVDLLPEEEVRHAIRQSSNPLKTFYRAWTLHEALFKLDSLSGLQPSNVLETRLSRLLPDGDVQAWLWHDNVWTLSICAHAKNLKVNSQPYLPLSRTTPPWFCSGKSN
jgi:phosphopantetheinyl transferase